MTEGVGVNSDSSVDPEGSIEDEVNLLVALLIENDT